MWIGFGILPFGVVYPGRCILILKKMAKCAGKGNSNEPLLGTRKICGPSPLQHDCMVV